MITDKLFSPAGAVAFRAQLLVWFDRHKRDLPWRRTQDGYAIWVSEIMLQQTRVAAVLEHYAGWMQQFPTVGALAAAAEQDVLAAWSGLGYYRRARFLHRGAQAVVREHRGDLPRTAAELRALPGIGAYTSAAIASIAFGEIAAVVDGNVERVLLRQAGGSEAGAAESGGAIKAAEVQALASRLIDPKRPGDFNQAMMELGATVCLPKKPLCLQCPVMRSCRTRGEHATRKRKPGVVAEIAYGLAQRPGAEGTIEVLLQQRAAKATVMAGLWELPQVEAAAPEAETLIVVRHAIMQTNYRVSVVRIGDGDLKAVADEESSPVWRSLAEVCRLPLTGLTRKILLRLGLLTLPDLRRAGLKESA